MRHGTVRRRLSAFLDGDLTPDAAARIERHLAACPACRAELASLRRVVDWLHDLPAEEPPPTLAPAIFARIAAEQPIRAGFGRSVRRWLETGWTAPLATAAVGLLVLAWLQGFPSELRIMSSADEAPSPTVQGPLATAPAPDAAGLAASEAPGIAGGAATVPVAESSGMPSNLGAVVIVPDAGAGLQDPSLGLPPLSSCVDPSRAPDPACVRWQAWMLGLALRDPLAFAAQLEAVPTGVREAWIGQLSRIAADSGSAPLVAEQLRASHDPRVAGLAVRLERIVTPIAPPPALPQH
jgi:hypothetical protein